MFEWYLLLIPSAVAAIGLWFVLRDLYNDGD